MRKIVFVASFIMMVSLAVLGLSLSGPAAANSNVAANTSAEPASTGEPAPSAAQCSVPITITKFDVLGRRAGGGHDTAVSWSIGALPDCTAIAEFRVKVALIYPSGNVRDKELTVAGNTFSTKVTVGGFPLDREPTSFKVTVIGIPKSLVTATGTKSGAVSTNP